MAPELYERESTSNGVHDLPPEYVGSPSEYAEADEVSDAVTLLAKVAAGTALSGSLLAILVGVVLVSCVICSFLAIAASAVFQ
jgi:hypothetical protein